MAVLLLLLSLVGTQDAASALADRLEAATPVERAAILEAEGPTETLSLACRQLGARSYKNYQDGKFDRAIELNRFIASAADVLKLPKMKGAAYQMIGQSLGSQNKHAEAIDTYQLGLPIAVQAGDARLQAILWSMTGASLRSLGRNEESRVAQETAVSIFKNAGLKAEAAQALNMLALAVRTMGQWQRAVDYYTEALTLAQTPDATNRALQGIAAVYVSQHDYDVALSFLERVSRPSGQSRPDLVKAAELDGMLGNIYLRLNRPEARTVLERSLAVSREIDNRVGEMWALQRLAELDEPTHPQLARERYQAAADYYGSIGDRFQQSSSLMYVARAATRAQQWDRAIEAAQSAVEAARQADSPLFISASLDELGRAFRGSGRTVDAAAAFEEATRWTEVQRSEIIGDDTSGASFLTDRAAPYTSLMDLRAQDGDTVAAIQLAEQVRARWLLDALTAGKVDPEAELTSQEKDRERVLSRDAARWNAELSRSAPASGARERFEKAARDLESYRAELYASHARLQARRAQAEPITREALLSLVPDRTTLLVEYAFCETGGWIFTIARGQDNAIELHATRLTATRADLEKRVDTFRRSLASRDLSYAPLARQLYRDLLAPIEAELKGRTSISIAPDAGLWNLPFHALIGPDGKHLIERAAVSYEPSLTALYGSVRARPAVTGRKTLLALAAGAADLPNATEEIQQLTRLYGPDSVALVGADATEEQWKRDADGFRVLHLATHGILNGANPLYSYLQLQRGGADDGMLEAREILGASLHAELIVLSACETGRGEVVGGEGLVGMSWAALSAGVPTAVVSQWKVDSTSTTQLMLAFHRAIAAAATRPGPIRGKAEALRAAELALIKTPQFRHPFYWAAFEMVGDGS